MAAQHKLPPSHTWFVYDGCTALVTGASRGIGAAFGESLARRKAHLVLLARGTDELKTLSQRLAQEHIISSDCITIDLQDPHAIGRVLAELKHRNIQIDLLINNAGYGLTGPFLSHAIEDEQGEIRVNIEAVMGLTHHIGAAMVERGCGGIINLASNASFQPLPWMATYAGTKAFVLHFSEALRYELRGTGVHVMAVCPGATATSFFGRGPGATDLMRGDSAQLVAENALRDFDRMRAVAYPGRLSVRVLTWLPRWLPRDLTVRLAAAAMKKMGVNRLGE